MSGKRDKSKGSWLSRLANLSDSAAKPIAAVASALALGTSVLWYRTDSEKKAIDLKLGRAELRLKEIEVQSAEPQFSVQYVMCGGAVFADMLGGSEGARLAATVEKLRGQVKNRKGVSEALDRFLGFPVINVPLRGQDSFKGLNTFLTKSLKQRLRDSDLVPVGYLVISIAAYGSQQISDVRVHVEKHKVTGSDFFLSEKTTFGDETFDDPLEAPIEGRNLKTSKVQSVIRVGDIILPGGVNIPLRRYYGAYDTTYVEDGSPAGGAKVFVGEFLVPVTLEYKNILGETKRVEIRPPLDYPMPVCDYIDIAG